MRNLFLTALLIAVIAVSNAGAQGQTAVQPQKMHPALLVIDIQNAFMPMIPEREKEMGLYVINAYIDLFRKYNFPVIRIYHSSPEEGPAQGTKEFEFPDTIKINPDDPQVIKTYSNAFTKTDLAKILREKNCNTLFLCGLSAVGCVLATYIGAEDNDFQPFMIQNGIMSHNSEYTDQIEQIFNAIGYDVVSTMLKYAEKP